MAQALVLGGGLRDVVCFQDFAVARTTPTEVDPTTVLFSYSRSSDTWTALTGGTALDCSPMVPAAVIPKLPGCRSV